MVESINQKRTLMQAVTPNSAPPTCLHDKMFILYAKLLVVNTLSWWAQGELHAIVRD